MNRVACPDHPDANLIEDYRVGDMICSMCGLVVDERVIDLISNDKSYWRKVMDGDESEDEENDNHWKNDYPDEDVEWDEESEEELEDNQRRESTLRDNGETALASNIRPRSPSGFDQSQDQNDQLHTIPEENYIIEKNKKSDLHSNIDPNVSEAPRIDLSQTQEQIPVVEYLEQQKITVMQGQGMRKVGFKRPNCRKRQLKDNLHIAADLEDYSEMTTQAYKK